MIHDLLIVHDYLIQMGGAERVVALMAKHFPDTPIFTSRTEYSRLLPEFTAGRIHNSWLQAVPLPAKYFKILFALYPAAFAALRLPDARIVWISASTFAKAVRKPPGSVSVCYCHSPTKFLWQTESYLSTEINSFLIGMLVRASLPFLRWIDKRSAQRVDYMIANSENIRKQIKTAYGRESTVIYPPVNVERCIVSTRDDGYYLIVSRLVGYKAIDRAVRAFANMPERTLHIIGDGTDRARLEAMSTPNVRFFGHVTEEELAKQFANCRAFIFPGYEDFGIAPVEAMAYGKPVIAFAAGGALETVIEDETGLFFRERSPESVQDAVLKLEQRTWDPWRVRKRAEVFSEARFLKQMKEFLETVAPDTKVTLAESEP